MPVLRLALAALLALLVAASGTAQDLPPVPDLTERPLPPPEPSVEVSALVQEGVRLHDAGDYEAALAQYDAVLEAYPGSPSALYERALTLRVMGRHAASGQAAFELLRYDGRFRISGIQMLAVAYDLSGRPEDARALLRAGVGLYPEARVLHHALAVTFSSRGDMQTAREHFRNAAAAAPLHGGSLLAYVETLPVDLYPVAVVLAGSRFLMIEFEGERSDVIRRALLDVLGGLVSERDGGGTEITLSLPSAAEGDPEATPMLNMLLGLSAAAERDLSDYARMVRQYEVLFGTLTEEPEPDAAFVLRHVGPLFAALAEAGHTRAFASVLYASVLPEADAWARAHTAEVEAFFAWLQDNDPLLQQ